MANKPKHTYFYPKKPDQATKSDIVSAEDKQLFRQTIGNIQPQSTQHLAPDQRNLHQKASQGNKSINPIETTRQIPPTAIQLTDHNPLDPVTGDAIIQFNQRHISAKQWRSLRTGKIPINRVLDLHGLYVEQAREQVSTLLQKAHEHRWQCVQIIHGRGHSSNMAHPILKNHVNHWLRQHPYVLAFHSCPNNMGGVGAVLILVKQ